MYDEQTFVQRILFPNLFSKFMIKFKLFPELGSEIFLRFNLLQNSDNWFYTFNTADVMLRNRYFEDGAACGVNNFPVVGGVLAKMNQKFLHVYPLFPLGAGLGNSFFELHLHRYPMHNDKLGLGNDFKNPKTVEHSFLIGSTDMDFAVI